MRFRHVPGASPVALLLALLVGCAQSSAPGDAGPVAGGCATDYSCPFGEECRGGGCAPIAASLYPHIQTASTLLRAPIDDAEQAWRAAHFDLNIGRLDPDVMRAANPGVRLFEYGIARYHVFDTVPGGLTQWALDHGYDPEDFYLHYREDTSIPGWSGTVVVPGFPPGIVPGWNPGGANASATERWQSRIPGHNNGTLWYLCNLEHPGFRGFLVDHAAKLVRGTWWTSVPFASGPVDGIMFDVAIYYPQFGEGQLERSVEYFGVPVNEDHPYAVANESTYPMLATALQQEFGATKDLMPNYSHVYYLTYPNRSAVNIQAATPWVWGEVWVTYTNTWLPTTGGNRCITYEMDYGNAVRAMVEQTRAGGRRVLGARDNSAGTTGTERGRLFTLGLYYLVHNRHTYYQYETMAYHELPAHIATWGWNQAVEYDIGQPDVIPAGALDFAGRSNTKEHYEFATGADPHVPSLTYHVLARRFTGGLVLVKMLPQGSVTDDRSITVHALDGNYAPLNADGTLGAAVNVAVIRNNEALILVSLD